jgi:hypothetical protein
VPQRKSMIPTRGEDHAHTTSWSPDPMQSEPTGLQGMIPNSANRIADKIMLKEEDGPGSDSVGTEKALGQGKENGP